MFTEEGAPIVKYYPSNLTLKMHNTKLPMRFFLTTFQKRNKTRKDVCMKVKRKNCKGKTLKKQELSIKVFIFSQN